MRVTVRTKERAMRASGYVTTERRTKMGIVTNTYEVKQKAKQIAEAFYAAGHAPPTDGAKEALVALIEDAFIPKGKAE
jgi:hypothetical protein